MTLRSLRTSAKILIGGSVAVVACILTWQIKRPGLHTTSATRQNMALQAKTVMVTGASRGLGLEFVHQLVKLPSPPEVLIAACRDPSKATALQSFAKSNPSVRVVKLDIEKDKDIESAYKEVEAAVGERGLNLLINNAAIYDQEDNGTLGHLTRSKLQKHFDINVSGPLLVTQMFLPLLQKAASQQGSDSLSFSRAGVVMMTSYMGSQQITFSDGAGESFHYKTSKSALNMAAIMLSRELKDKGIIVLALHPGWVRTDMGGKSAFYTPEQSIQSCLKVLGNADGEFNGKLVSYEEKVLPF